jgi:virginiamycin B lyase
LAVSPDGSIWFAEMTRASVTQFKDGRFIRHSVARTTGNSPDAFPFGVAVAPDGTVWATLQNADALLRISPGGETTAIDVPIRQSGLSDIAIAKDGAVWFLAAGANKIGRYAGGRFEEFSVPTPNAGLTALAVAPDGAAWFTALRAHRLGRVNQGFVTEFALPRDNARPISIAVDAGNNVWYADLAGWIGKLSADRAQGR